MLFPRTKSLNLGIPGLINPVAQICLQILSHSILPSFTSWLIWLGWSPLMVPRWSQDGVMCRQPHAYLGERKSFPEAQASPLGLKGQNGVLGPFLKPATSKGSSVTIDLDRSTFIPWGWGQLSRELWLPDSGTKLGFSLGREMWSGERVLLGRQLTGIPQFPLCPELHCFCTIGTAPWSKGDADLGECLAPHRGHKNTVIRWL